ncbi:Anaphase-promoting complex, cyclosome, subunit 3 [Roseovarius litorisediminis]|uniref:Anaphase-promoting complex, cyclosome, subunit 3 n=1 Tax=Roseovarius litorisediminis TaxID=1312363 RepID=A0A1Y5SR73_9RHOB|nr:tetratricopeptide repeat protein [Roseovarius litorisediminis]SLN46323.1 Anaphase-promoting complex, cyclosome, subunit 3 [Roseovarius litorisediminis]
MTKKPTPPPLPNLLNRALAQLDSGSQKKAQTVLKEITSDTLQVIKQVQPLLRATRLAGRAAMPELARRCAKRALEIEPQNPILLSEIADLDLKQGRPVDLAQLPDEITAATDAQTARYLFIRGKALQAAGQNSQAVKHFRRAAAKMTDNAEYQARLAQALLQDLAFDEAGTVARSLLKKQPDNPACSAVLARLALQNGDLVQAQTLITKVRQKAPGNFEYLMVQIDTLTAGARFIEAIKALTDWLSDHPQHNRSRLKLASLLTQQRELKLAEAVMRDFDLGKAPGLVAEYGQLMTVLGHSENMVMQLQHLLDEGGASAAMHVELARQLTLLKRHEEREDVIRRCLAQFPGNRQMLLFALEQGDLPPEPEMLNKLLGHTPKPRAVNAIASSLHAVGDYNAMLAHLRTPTNRTATVQRSAFIARALVGLAELGLAIRYLRFALRRWPLAMELQGLLVQALIKSGRFDDALKLIKDQPHPAKSARMRQWQMTASLYVHKADLPRAEAAVNEARKLDPESRYHAADLLRQYISLGLYEKARFERTYNDNLSTDRHPHWSISLNGQLYGELEIEHRNGLNFASEPMGVDRLAEEVLKRPRSNIAALRFLAEWMQDERRQPNPDQARPIPAKIYQYWDRSDRPREVDRLMQSWQDLPGIDWQVYDRPGALALLRKSFGPKWVQAFNLANNPAEEADLLRLCLLTRYGGIWADADDRLVGDLTQLLAPGNGLVLFHEALGNAVGNNFIASQPGHPALILAARRARGALLQRSNETTWSKTGPGLLSRSVTHILAQRVADNGTHAIRILEGGKAEREIVMHNRLSAKLGSQHWRQTSTGKAKPLAKDLLAALTGG